jgi:tetratricopeptide (TPR) repeat protein
MRNFRSCWTLILTLLLLFFCCLSFCDAAKMDRKVKLEDRLLASEQEKTIVKLARKGQIELSLKECERALQKKPNDSHLKLLKAQILRFLVRDEEAISVLTELRSASDLDCKELDLAAETALALDDLELTKYYARKAVALLPEALCAPTLLKLGSALNDNGEYEEAEKVYAKAVRIDKGLAALDTAVYFYKARKKPNLVVKYCSMALERNSDPNSLNVVRHHKFRAQALLELGKPSEALSDLNYCVEKTPHDSHSFRLRAQTYEKLGKKALATADRKKADEIDKSMLDSNGLFGK